MPRRDSNARAPWRLVVFGLVPIAAACSNGGDASGNVRALPSVSVADASVEEGDSGSRALHFELTLSATSDAAVSVDVATADDSAAAPTDYTALQDRVTIAGGSTSATVAVDVAGDTDDEGDETFFLTLGNPANATLGDDSAVGTIVDDDAPGGAVFGLDARPDNATCVAPPRPDDDASVSVVDAFPNLPAIERPTKMLLEPVVAPRWFVLQRAGQVVTFDPDDATSLATYLDLSAAVRTSGEGGLLGMAFHPDYPATPEIFLSYTVDHSGPPMRSVISRVVLDDVASPGNPSEEILLVVDQDFDNHNGGDIAFGPDGYLYIGLGDGGGGNDPNDRAQDTTRLLGSMLRIDVLGAGAEPYRIPADNPFAGNPPCGPAANAADCPEIYAWGLRNPWRWAFDPETRVLWLADVGQNDWEEVNRVERGGNYGWRCREGAHENPNISAVCDPGLIDPIAEYSHDLGDSVTGGRVYRGAAIPGLAGRYLFADFGSGRFWALRPDGEGGYANDELIDTNAGPTSFGVDRDGELYVTDFYGGRLLKLAPAGAAAPDTVAARLSDTGCTDPEDVTQAYGGLVPYDLNAAYWSDGAAMDRYLGLPNGTAITRAADGDWQFPAGTVLVQNFRLNGDLVETRHLMRHPDGVWAGYSYAWNSEQTEAMRIAGGTTVTIGAQEYRIPSAGECLECHTSAAGFALGPRTAQLNRDFTYPSTQRTANQLETLDHLLMFTSPLPGPASGLPSMANPADTGASLADRARAYLHTNCASCHRPGGPTPSTMDLRYATALGDTGACDALPLGGDLGIAGARLIAPGEAARSLVVARAERRDSHGMPPVATNRVDVAGVDLLRSWIDGLAGCN